jgi:hypothetical protein
VKATAAAACAFVLVAAGCGSLVSGTPPSPKDVMTWIANADLRDAHVSIAGSPGGTADMDLRADGDVVFKPGLAFHLTTTTTMGTVATAGEVLSVAGATYQRAGGGRWTPGPILLVPAVLAAWTGAAHPRYVGEERIAGAQCWHVAAGFGGSSLDLWVREPDGLPARVRVDQLVVDYGRYNRGLSIAPPAAGAVRPQPKSLMAAVGQVAHLDGVDVTVSRVEPSYRPASRALAPRPGSRYVVAQVAYTLTGAEPVAYGPEQWRLTDATGTGYLSAFLDRQPVLARGDLAAQGASAGGFIAYEAPVAARGLLLVAAIGEDRVTVALN